MINFTTLLPVASSAPESEPPELRPCGDASEGDPLRQLFRRNANHLNSAHTRRIQARLKHRLFAEDSELG